MESGYNEVEDLPPPEETVPPSPLGGQSVQIIDGVGPHYAKRLKEAGIETLSQLAEFDPFAVEDISVKLLEFQRKAEMAMSVKVDAEIFGPLLGLSVSDILRTPRSDFVELLAEGFPQAWAQYDTLMEGLRTLQVVLDDDFLGGCRLGDLARG